MPERCSYCGGWITVQGFNGPHDGSCAVRLGLADPPPPRGPVTAWGPVPPYIRPALWSERRPNRCHALTAYNYFCNGPLFRDGLCKIHDPERKAARLANAETARERAKAAKAKRDVAIRQMLDESRELTVARMLIGLRFRRVA